MSHQQHLTSGYAPVGRSCHALNSVFPACRDARKTPKMHLGNIRAPETTKNTPPNSRDSYRGCEASIHTTPSTAARLFAAASFIAMQQTHASCSSRQRRTKICTLLAHEQPRSSLVVRKSIAPSCRAASCRAARAQTGLQQETS
jgi:hypothetical protein